MDRDRCTKANRQRRRDKRGQNLDRVKKETERNAETDKGRGTSVEYKTDIHDQIEGTNRIARERWRDR